MANSVVKLTIDSAEYDAKLKSAGDALNKYFDIAKKGDRTFEVLDDGVMDVIKAMGKMETSSKSAKGQLSELQKEFTDLSLIYKRFTEQEKASPVGKEMAKSLDELKARIDDTKENLAEVTTELNGGGGGGLKGALDAVAGKFGLNIQQLAGWGAALGAAKLGLEAMKKTIDATESSSDEFAQAQLELSSAVNSFFRNMNEGSFTNFLQGLSDVASMAKEAYQAMDELGSFSVRYNPRNSADMQRIDKLLKEARALQAKGDKEGAAAKTAEATRVAEQAKANTTAYGQKEYDAGMSTLKSLLGGTGVKFTEGQIEYYSDPKNWEKVKDAANDYGTALKNLQTAEANLASIGQTGNNKMIALYNERYQAAKRAYDAQSESNRRAYTYLNTRDTAGTEQGDKFIRATQQIYGKQMAEYAVDAIQARIDRADAVANKVGGGKSGKSPATEATYELLEDVRNEKPKVYDFMDATSNVTASMKDLQQQMKLYKDILANATTQSEYNIGSAGVSALQRQMKLQPIALEGGITIAEAEVETLGESLKENLEAYFKDNPIEFKSDSIAQDGKNAAKTWKDAASALQSVGQAFNQIEDPAAKVAGTLAQAVASVALGYAQATKMAAETSGPWGWIAFAAAGLAQMVATISTIKSVAHYAQGGIVGGNDYTDKTPVMVSSGELILNRSQQENLVSHLNNGGGAVALSQLPYVTGEKIVLGVNNWAKQTGRGQLVFSKS